MNTKNTTLNLGFIQQQNSADIADNRRRIAEKATKLAQGGSQLIVFQELHDSLYFCQTEDVKNFDLADSIPGQASDFYATLSKELGVVLVTSLFERRSAGIYHNTAVVFEKDGSIAGRYRKMHIPDDPAYYEKFYFTPGDLGFVPIQTSVGRLGVMVCWDQWFPEAARLMALAGAQILIYPTAIGFEQSDSAEEQQRQREAWITIQRGHAIANGLPLVAVNRVGLEEDPSAHTQGIRFWGNSFVCGPQGEILKELSDKKEAEGQLTIHLEHSEDVHRWWPFFRDRRIDEYKDLTKRSLR